MSNSTMGETVMRVRTLTATMLSDKDGKGDSPYFYSLPQTEKGNSRMTILGWP